MLPPTLVYWLYSALCPLVMSLADAVAPSFHASRRVDANAVGDDVMGEVDGDSDDGGATPAANRS